MWSRSYTVIFVEFDKIWPRKGKNRMTDAMVRLSNQIFQESDVFYSFRFVERQMNDIFFLTHAEGTARQ